jgi:homogentisate 1,2-dioxygenase
MPLYHKLGTFPQKKTYTIEKPNGGLYYEQLFGTEGFHGIPHYSIMYIDQHKSKKF